MQSLPDVVAFKRTDEHILAYQHSRELAAMLYYINKASSSEVVWLLAVVPHTPILLNTLKLRLEAGSWRSQRFWPPGEELAPPLDWHDEALPSEDALGFSQALLLVSSCKCWQRICSKTRTMTITKALPVQRNS